MASVSEHSGGLQRQLEDFERQHNPHDPQQVKVMQPVTVAAFDDAVMEPVWKLKGPDRPCSS